MSLQIPTLSLKELLTRDQQPALTAACEQLGLFYLVDHGMDAAHTAALLDAMSMLFHLPAERKQRIARTRHNPWGFYDKELTKNRRDWKQIWDIGPTRAGADAQWPDLPGFEPVVREHYTRCEALAAQLLSALARCMHAEPEQLLPAFAEHTSFLRLNYYPPCPTPAPAHVKAQASHNAAGNLGISHHTDAGALTVLVQDEQPGLQVEQDGRWLTVEPQPGALVINIGDIVQVWSNDRFRAPLHRVLASRDAQRFSAAFFFNPSYDCNYAPLPGQPGAGAPRYRAINWGQFRNARSDGDYADYGAEIQIDDFRLT